MQMRPLAAINMRKPFLPEEHTQLYYTPVYGQLHFEHRLRYNQLFGVRVNEYIMMLEADLVERLANLGFHVGGVILRALTGNHQELFSFGQDGG